MMQVSRVARWEDSMEVRVERKTTPKRPKYIRIMPHVMFKETKGM
jgi:hypothetical protein